MGVERIRSMFDRCRQEGRAALLPFMTAGLPDLASSPAVFKAMAEAGADGFEVGIPYSDPLMDGPVIQEGAARALRAGANLTHSLEVVGEVAALGPPTLVMTYVNPVARLGAGEFCRRVAAAGADGIIIADLPVDESGPFRAAASNAGLGMVLFVAPTSDVQRLAQVAAADPAFIYGVSDLGVTGEREHGSGRSADLAGRVRAVTNLPLVLGVGISTTDQVAEAGRLADGVIVGSALVRRVLKADSSDEAAHAAGMAVKELAAALR